MRVEIIQEGRALRHFNHDGKVYAEVPESGDFQVRLTNDSSRRRMAVVSVDGRNVVDGTEAGYDGSGYVLDPWQSVTIPGWLRSNQTCARFTLVTSEESYAAKMGAGTKNVGVVGVAVFDEKPKPVMFQPPPIIIREEHHHHWPKPSPFWWSTTTGNSGSFGSSYGSSTVRGSSDDFTLSAESGPSQTRGSVQTEVSRGLGEKSGGSGAKDVGTGYGAEAAFYTRTAEFTRATRHPSLGVTLRYGVTAKLREWGVPVDTRPVAEPNPFPAAPGYAPPPPGWAAK